MRGKEITREKLFDMYWNQRLSLRKIATELGVSDTTIGTWMLKYGIPRRAKGEAQQGKHLPDEVKKKISRTKIERKHPGWNKGLTKEIDDRVRGYAEKLKGRRAGRIPWNKGLTKETDARVHNYAQKLKLVGRVFRGKDHPMYGRRHTLESRIKMSKNRPRWFGKENPFYRKTHSDEAKKKMTLWHKGKKLSEAHRRKIAEAVKRNWQSPEYIRRVMDGLNKKPNRAEKLLDSILQRVCPNEFKYNGNFELGVAIGEMIPDWVNVNGKKKIIELFGDHWHLDVADTWKRTEQGRKETYNKLGFDVLVIWDNELKNEEEVVKKIENFMVQ